MWLVWRSNTDFDGSATNASRAIFYKASDIADKHGRGAILNAWWFYRSAMLSEDCKRDISKAMLAEFRTAENRTKVEALLSKVAAGIEMGK